MRINVGDRIRYNINHFNKDRPALIVDTPVVKIATQETGYGEYEEYLTPVGIWVSELQLV